MPSELFNPFQILVKTVQDPRFHSFITLAYISEDEKSPQSICVHVGDGVVFEMDDVTEIQDNLWFVLIQLDDSRCTFNELGIEHCLEHFGSGGEHMAGDLDV